MFSIELVAAILSAVAVWLTATRRPIGWPIALISVALYAWVFMHSKLYSDALLQGIFAVLIVYGWWRWLQHLDDGGKVLIARLAVGKACMHLCLGALVALVLGWFMQRHTDAALPWLDAALAAASLVAQWWEAKRHRATWWLWILIDSVYIGVYVYKDLLVTAILYAGFILLAVRGLYSWKQAGQSH